MIHSSPITPIHIPAVSMGEFVMQYWSRYGDKAALIDASDGRKFTYAQLLDGVRRAAGALQARGLRKGDVFALCCPNSAEYVMVFHGAALAGCVVTTMNPLNSREEIAKQLEDSGTRWMMTTTEGLDKVAGLGLEGIFVLGEWDFLSSAPIASAAEIDPQKDLAALPYSSGTTGGAKGVMLTHANMVSAACQVFAMEPLRAEDVIVSFLPFYHIFGMQFIMNCALRAGLKIVLMSRFDFETYLRLSAQHRATRAYVVPPVALALAKSALVGQYDLSSLRVVFSGAAPLGDSLARTVAQRLNVEVRQGYGMTETSTLISMVPPGWKQELFDSVGVIAPNSEMQIVDGEIWVRGPHIMKGYLNRPEATRDILNADGWLRTGDIGHVDDSGYLHVVDRLKELIKYKGMQVPPAELEALLLAHPAVADAAVIGVPDEEAGEIPKAFVVKKAEVTAEELMAHVARQVAPHKKVRIIEFMDAIPKSPSGKILRRMLRGPRH